MATIDLFHKEDQYDPFKRGQVIFREGDPPGRVMYIVYEGEVELRIHDKTVEILGPGGVLGEMALIDKEPRSATAIAKTDCKLVPIDERRFNFLVQQTPNFALQMMRVISARLRRMDANL
jgi:CRP-like cAMP-binding protein